MAPVRAKKRESDSSLSSRHRDATSAKVPLKDGPSTPQQRSPIRKKKTGISLHHKQALIDNLQLEITERARRLRAQYNVHAQNMRSRIEIRINRIPTALRKATMGDLLAKYMEQEQNRVTGPKPPPVPAKDTPRGSTQRNIGPKADRPQQQARSHKRMSDEISRDKENDMDHMENPKKKTRGGQGQDGAPVRPTQVLSPTSSNSRLTARERPASPTKSQIGRPGSPLKGAANRYAGATTTLSNMVEKAKATRNAGTRKVTTASNASSNSNTATTAATSKRPRGRPPASAAPKATASIPGSRMRRRVSNNSETSEGSTGTVVKQNGAKKAVAAPTSKKTMMGTIRKGVAANAAAKKTTAKPAAAATSATGRVLRKRG